MGNSVSPWAAGCYWDASTKNLAAFCSHPKNLPEDELKSNGLISLEEDVSRQLLHIGSVKWLLVALVYAGLQ